MCKVYILRFSLVLTPVKHLYKINKKTTNLNKINQSDYKLDHKQQCQFYQNHEITKFQINQNHN